MMLGDIAITRPGAVIGFAGSLAIEETIRETLPDGFQRFRYLRDHGMVDMVDKTFGIARNSVRRWAMDDAAGENLKHITWFPRR